jgi:hypothetical protein
MRDRQLLCLEQDLEGVASFLDEFGEPQNGEARSVEANPTGDLVCIRNFPLPEGYDPDFVDVLMLTHRYPDAPPVGLYLLEQSNAETIAQLGRKFNVLNYAAHSAPTVAGYRWICFTYQDNCWRFNHRRIAYGDSLRKFLINFFQQCSVEK